MVLFDRYIQKATLSGSLNMPISKNKLVKWIIWGTDYLDWYTFDNVSDNSGGVEFRALFAMETNNNEKKCGVAT